MKYCSTLLIFLSLTTSAAEDSTQTSIPQYLAGHNLSPTTDVLPEGKTILGTYVYGYGLTDRWMIATCPWLIVGYNMPNVGIKYSTPSHSIFKQVSSEFLYFKTINYGLKWYRQNSLWWRNTGTIEVLPQYSIHSNLGFQYFFDDSAPFSMRPPTLTNTPITLSISTLHQYEFDSKWGTFAEFGLLGANYSNKYLQIGASVFYRFASGYIQLGISQSVRLGPKVLPDQPIREWIDNLGDSHSSVFYLFQSPIHPEIQIQFYL